MHIDTTVAFLREGLLLANPHELRVKMIYQDHLQTGILFGAQMQWTLDITQGTTTAPLGVI